MSFETSRFNRAWYLLLLLPLAALGWPEERPSRTAAAVAGLAPGLMRWAPPTDDARVIVRDEVVTAPATPTVRTEIGRGGTLAGALDQVGLSPAETARVTRALGPWLEMKRLSGKTGLAAGRALDGTRVVSIRAAEDAFLRLRLAADGEPFEIEEVPLPIEVGVETTGGRVTSSVYGALAGSPHGRELTLAFAELFQWDVDLLVDPRPGDVVRVVYEVRRLGRVPADLPPFGDAPRTTGEVLGIGRVLAASYEGQRASSNAFWVSGGADRGGYYDERGRQMHKTFLRSPLNYRRISSGFSRARRHPVTRQVVPHLGVDFAAPSGTPVVAAADGRVISVRREGPLGLAIRLRHGSEYTTVYGHLKNVSRDIRPGVEVDQNQVIGYVGSTGRATGPHLHYTMLQRGRAVDPLTFRNPPAEPLPGPWRPRLELALSTWSPLLGAILPAKPRRA